jgi:hypothetical protein
MGNLDGIRTGHPHLAEFAVDWFAGHDDGKTALRDSLSVATREQDLQAVIEKHPVLLARTLGGGHGRWVIPRKRLGSEYVTDFVVGAKSSVGFEWVAVELESPTHRMFNLNGDPNAALNHAIRQIQDWRAWLRSNQNYAARTRQEAGLGLTDVDHNLPGLILIGRRDEISPETKARRRQYSHDLRIRIHSFDWLLDGPEQLMLPGERLFAGEFDEKTEDA